MLIKEVFNRLANKKTNDLSMSSGFTKLDRLIGNYENKLILLGGRPGMGKSSLARNIATNMALEGLSVLYLTIEAKLDVTLKILACESNIPYMRIITSQISSEEYIELTNVAAKLAELRFDIHNIKDPVKTSQYNIVVIDSIDDDPKIEINTLKEIANYENSCYLVVTDLSEIIDRRFDKRPKLSDLLNNNMERVPDVVMFLYRDVYYNEATDYPAKAQLIVAKNKNGYTDTIYLDYIKELSKFENE